MRRAALLTIALVSCGGASGPVPKPDLGMNVIAQRDLAHMRDTWERSDREGRSALEDPLRQHVARYPRDPSTRVARVMLALIALEKGDIDRAATLAGPLAAGHDGATKDAAVVVVGATLRRRGRAAEALARLQPLFQKLIDPVARNTLNRELVLAAVETGKYADASRFLQAYVRQAKREDRQQALSEAAALVDRIPAPSLLGVLAREQAAEEPDVGFLDLLADALARYVTDKEDVALAKRLLEIAGPLLGDRADGVARIAARGAAVRLERNTLGLVLPIRNEELRRRGVEVAAGLALALGLPGGKARLVTRDDGGDAATIDDALALLNADGAAVIVAGFDTKEADVASAYAERTGLPVVLLRPPSKPIKQDGPVFVLGEIPGESRALLARELAERGHDKVAVLVADRDGTDKTVAQPNVVGVQQCGASLDFVKTAGADALVVDGHPTCAAEAAAAGGIALGFGLDAGAAGARGLYAGAGIFPSPLDASDDPLLRAWQKMDRGAPTWWTGLGHDAGVLVKDAILKLPADSEDGEDRAAAARRKAAATEAVARAEGKLWTTEAKGFGGKRAIPRTVTVIDRGASRSRRAPPTPRR